MNTPSIRPLPNCLVKQVAEESNEVPSRIPDELESLREWIKKQNHLTARTGNAKYGPLLHFSHEEEPHISLNYL